MKELLSRLFVAALSLVLVVACLWALSGALKAVAWLDTHRQVAALIFVACAGVFIWRAAYKFIRAL